MTTPSKPLLTVRAALVLSLAITIGLIAGVLSFLGGDSTPSAVLIGGGATSGALLLLHKIIDN